MKTFKSKLYSSKTKVVEAGKQSIGQMVKEGAVKGASNPIALASLGIGSTGLYLNYKTKSATEKRNIEADRQHGELLRQNERLIRALGGVEKGLQNVPNGTSVQFKPKEQESDNSWLKIKGRKIFSEKKEKNYGIVSSSMLHGATLGSGVGAGIGLAFASKAPNKAMISLCGAALGALAGGILGTAKVIDQKISQSRTGHKLIEEVIKNLQRAGFKENQDYVTDPKKASQLKTKVCVVISRKADELGLLINMINDKDLKKVSDKILTEQTRNIQKTEKFSDKFNDIQVTSFPSSDDPVYIYGILSNFIKAGYPVYILEVG